MRGHTGCTASSAPTRRMQSACDTQMRVQGVISLSASITMNLHDSKSTQSSTQVHMRCISMVFPYFFHQVSRFRSSGGRLNKGEMNGRSRMCTSNTSRFNENRFVQCHHVSRSKGPPTTYVAFVITRVLAATHAYLRPPRPSEPANN